MDKSEPKHCFFKYEDTKSSEIYSVIKLESLPRSIYPVFKVRIQNSAGEEVSLAALKILSFSSPQDEKKIENEINILKKTHHENIVTFIHSHYIIESKENKYYILMEYCENGDLRSYNPLSEIQIRNYFIQIYNGLHYLHSQNIAHRDLKPPNILINSKEKIKIADYGLSKVFLDEMKSCVGTQGFKAPEVLKRDLYGLEADIFSLGVTLYWLYFREKPWKTCDIIKGYEEDLKSGIFEGKSIEISPEAKDLILKMITLKKEDRITLAEIKTHPYIKAYFDILIKELESEGKNISFIQKTFQDIEELEIFCRNKQIWVAALYHLSYYVSETTKTLYSSIKAEKNFILNENDWPLFDDIKNKIKEMKKNAFRNYKIIELKIDTYKNNTNKDLIQKIKEGNYKIALKALLSEYELKSKEEKNLARIIDQVNFIINGEKKEENEPKKASAKNNKK